MAANELAERLQAMAWVKVQGLLGLLTEDGLGLRSVCGFEQRLIVSEVPKEFPFLILPLERYHTRAKTVVTVQGLVTVDDATRLNYPGSITPATSYQAPPKVQPIDLAWMGDLTNPDWYPFQSTAALPASFDRNLYNAVAIYLPLTGGTLAGDFIVCVHECPPIEGSVTIQKIVPSPLPPPPPP